MIRVMLVDDEPFVRVAIKSIFNWETYGYQIVSEANNGENAVLQLKYEQPDLVITDIKMPILDGIELIKYISAHFPRIKCVVLSNYSDYELTRAAFTEGAVDYVLKNDLNEESFAELCTRLSQKYFPDASKQKSLADEEIGGNNYAGSSYQSIALATAIERNCCSEFEIKKLEQNAPFTVCVISPFLNHHYHYDRTNEKLIFNTIEKIISELSEFRTVFLY